MITTFQSECVKVYNLMKWYKDNFYINGVDYEKYFKEISDMIKNNKGDSRDESRLDSLKYLAESWGKM